MYASKGVPEHLISVLPVRRGRSNKQLNKVAPGCVPYIVLKLSKNNKPFIYMPPTTNAGQLGLGSSRPEPSRLGSSRPGPILSLVGMCLIKNSLFNKS